MYCWKCGQELTEGAGSCVYCNASQNRPEPTSEAGKALRMLYDRYGQDAVLNNPLMLVNGLGDLVQDAQKLRGQMKIALDAGLGRMYLDQLNDNGAPDAAFDKRVKVLLTDDAGLSDKIAGEIAGYFDEMIGWRATSEAKPANEAQPQPAVESREETDRATGQVYQKPETNPPKKSKGGVIAAVIVALLVIGVGLYALTNGNQAAPTATTAPTATIKPTAVPTPTIAVPEKGTPYIIEVAEDEAETGCARVYYSFNGVTIGKYWFEVDYGTYVKGLRNVDSWGKRDQENDSMYVPLPLIPGKECRIRMHEGLGVAKEFGFAENSPWLSYTLPLRSNSPIALKSVETRNLSKKGMESDFRDYKYIIKQAEIIVYYDLNESIRDETIVYTVSNSKGMIYWFTGTLFETNPGEARHYMMGKDGSTQDDTLGALFLSMYESGGIETGEYTIDIYARGAYAGSFSFTITD